MFFISLFIFILLLYACISFTYGVLVFIWFAINESGVFCEEKIEFNE